MNSAANQILALLRSEQGSYLSGDSLGKITGTSRAAVWKQIRSLRKKGFEIEGVPRLGYRLLSEPDLLNHDALKSEGHYSYSTLDSTNREARRRSASINSFFSAFISEEQTQGRGRLDRSWASSPGRGIWFSLLLKPGRLNPAAAAPVTLTAAAVIAAYFNRELHIPVKIKWPNDLLLTGKKMGGILTEMTSDPDGVKELIIGIGLNINHEEHDFPEEIRPGATSAFIYKGKRIDRTNLLLSLCKELEPALRFFCHEGFKPFYQTWVEFNCTLGKKVTANRSGEVIHGLAANLDHEGNLLIEESSGKLQRINYGEIL